MIRNELFAQIVRFNWSPASYADSSWLSPWLTPGLFETLRLNPESASTLNQFLLEHLDLQQGIADEAVADPALNLILLPADALQRVVLYLGLTLHNLPIKQIICGKTQREVREQIGEDAFQFAIKRAQFMIGSLKDMLRMEVVLASATNNIKADSISIGLMLLADATKHLASPVTARMLLKFHQDDAEKIQQYWRTGLHAYVKDSETSEKVSSQIKGLLLKVVQELYPQWQTALA